MKIPESEKKSGFTLVELLVVIAIVAVLVSLGVGGIFKYRNAAAKTGVMNSLRALQVANASYASENNGRFCPVYGFDGDGKSNTQWAWNKEFMVQLMGAEYAYAQNGWKFPLSFLDQKVVRLKGTNWNQISASFGYNQENPANWGKKDSQNGLLMSQLADPARSFSFVTCTDWIAKYEKSDKWTEAVTGYNSDGMISFRYDGKGAAVYYDGHVEMITPEKIRKIKSGKGRLDPFWNATARSNEW